jgi:hypothetical protein
MAHARDPGCIGLPAGEILGEPDDQVVVQAHLRAFAERPLAQAPGESRDADSIVDMNMTDSDLYAVSVGRSCPTSRLN